MQVAALRPNCTTAVGAVSFHRTLLFSRLRSSSGTGAFILPRAVTDQRIISGGGGGNPQASPTLPPMGDRFFKLRSRLSLDTDSVSRYGSGSVGGTLVMSAGRRELFQTAAGAAGDHDHVSADQLCSGRNLSTGRIRIHRRNPSCTLNSMGRQTTPVIYCTATGASGGTRSADISDRDGLRDKSGSNNDISDGGSSCRNISSTTASSAGGRRHRGGRTSCAAPKAGSEDDMVYRNTVYDHCDWNRHRSNTRHSRHMLAVASSRVVAGLLPPVLKLTLVAAVVALANRWWGFGLVVSSLPFQLAAPAVALLLVFRTNASYGRFDEARKAWAAVANRTRDMARQAVAFAAAAATTTAAAQQRSHHNQELRRLLCYLVAFPYCLKDHLTRGENEELEAELGRIMASEAEIDSVLDAPHRPGYVLQLMTELVHDSTQLNDMQKALLDANLTNLHDSVGACERLFTTPIPLSYTRLTSRILVLWHLLLPLALWEQCSWVTVPATFLSAAVFFCIEEVGVLIEEPFSILPLANISDTVRQSVETIFRHHQGIIAHHI